MSKCVFMLMPTLTSTMNEFNLHDTYTYTYIHAYIHTGKLGSRPQKTTQYAREQILSLSLTLTLSLSLHKRFTGMAPTSIWREVEMY